MDVDIGKLPEPHRLSPATEPASIPTLDGWIESLMNCKQLAENDVQRLCDRVGREGCGIKSGVNGWVSRLTQYLDRLARYCRTSQMFSQLCVYLRVSGPFDAPSD